WKGVNIRELVVGRNLEDRSVAGTAAECSRAVKAAVIGARQGGVGECTVGVVERKESIQQAVRRDSEDCAVIECATFVCRAVEAAINAPREAGTRKTAIEIGACE